MVLIASSPGLPEFGTGKPGDDASAKMYVTAQCYYYIAMSAIDHLYVTHLAFNEDLICIIYGMADVRCRTNIIQTQLPSTTHLKARPRSPNYRPHYVYVDFP